MNFAPYLYFNGLAEDALKFYAHVFKTDEPVIQRYRDAPPTEGDLPRNDHVMYGHIELGGERLMASDVPDGTPYSPQASVSIYHEVDDYEEGEELFRSLLRGGEELMPWGPTFFSPGFGHLKDRFGTHWMIGLPG